MIIGKLTERVTFRAPAERRGLSGEATLNWDTITATVWAEVGGLSARDIMQAQQANVIATHRIRIRGRDDITHLHRVEWRGTTMEIASVVDRGSGDYLEILAREVQ